MFALHSAKSSGTASPKPPRQVCSSPSESSSTRCPAWHCASSWHGVTWTIHAVTAHCSCPSDWSGSCYAACCAALWASHHCGRSFPTAPLVLLVLRWLTELPWRQLLPIRPRLPHGGDRLLSVARHRCGLFLARIQPISASAGRDWSICCCLTSSHWSRFWHPLHDSIPATFDSPIHQQRLLAAYLAVSVRFVRDCGVVHAGGQFHAADSHMLEIAFTVAVVYSCFMVLAYFLIWYMIQQSDRLLAARRRQHYEALQTLQLQHMNERIREAVRSSTTCVTTSTHCRRWPRLKTWMASAHIWMRCPNTGCCNRHQCSIASMRR